MGVAVGRGVFVGLGVLVGLGVFVGFGVKVGKVFVYRLVQGLRLKLAEKFLSVQ